MRERTALGSVQSRGPFLKSSRYGESLCPAQRSRSGGVRELNRWETSPAVSVRLGRSGITVLAALTRTPLGWFLVPGSRDAVRPWACSPARLACLAGWPTLPAAGAKAAALRRAEPDCPAELRCSEDFSRQPHRGGFHDILAANLRLVSRLQQCSNAVRDV